MGMAHPTSLNSDAGRVGTIVCVNWGVLFFAYWGGFRIPTLPLRAFVWTDADCHGSASGAAPCSSGGLK